MEVVTASDWARLRTSSVSRPASSLLAMASSMGTPDAACTFPTRAALKVGPLTLVLWSVGAR